MKLPFFNFSSTKRRLLPDKVTPFVSLPLLWHDLNELEQAYGAQVDHTISPNDEMFVPQGEAHYFGVGCSALRCINLALGAAGCAAPRSILDLPCGHGRVLRMLKLAFPQAELTAVDLNRDGVDFCAAQFGAKPLYSSTSPARIKLSEQYDLIWSGSLLTHLDAPQWAGFLKLFCQQLHLGGVAIFTTHGQVTLDRMRERDNPYGMLEKQKERFLAEYKKHGFGYKAYYRHANYGISLCTPAWVLQEAAKLQDWRLAAYFPQCWDNHQDVWAYKRIAA